MTLAAGAAVALQVLVAFAAVATVYVYYRQLKVMSGQLAAMRESARGQSSLSLVVFLQAPDVREARHVVRRVLSKKPITDWTAEERASASVVVANYDVAAALIRADVASVQMITANWGPSIRHCYEVLRPFILEQRALPGGSSRYWSNFEWLAAEAAKDRG